MVLDRKVKIACTACLAVAASMTVAQIAGATIVPQQGMGGVKLGNDKSQVRDKLGQPKSIVNGRNDFGAYTTYRYKRGITVIFQSGPTVTTIRTSGRKERTKSGIGVGSSEQSVKDKYPRVKCRALIKNRSCYLGELIPGKRVTDFQIRDGKVRWIAIGFVTD